jgi:hypothetical protein
MSEQTALTVQEPREPSVLEVIAAAARDPQVQIEKWRDLLELKERVEAGEAKRAFQRAFSSLKIPAIKTTRQGHNNRYAPFEEIQAVIQPHLDAAGFTLSFKSGPGSQPGWLRIDGVLSHTAGHSELASMELPIDKSGSMNAIQGVGSTYSYGQRYVTKGLLNLRIVGDDNDGNSAEPISEAQASKIRNMIDANGWKPATVRRFLDKICGAAADVETIQARYYDAALEMLRPK